MSSTTIDISAGGPVELPSPNYIATIRARETAGADAAVIITAPDGSVVWECELGPAGQVETHGINPLPTQAGTHTVTITGTVAAQLVHDDS